MHDFHSTVSLIRTLELCIGIAPMNFLDSNAVPIDIFTGNADLRPYDAQLPTIALDNLYPPDKANAAMAYYMDLTSRQDLSHADMADPRELNEIIWYSVKRNAAAPGIARNPVYDLMRTGIKEEEEKSKRSGEDE